MKRMAAVAGQFYHAEPGRLVRHVESLVEPDAEKVEARAVLCPHAGLVYSGAVAGAVYSRIRFPDTFVLVGPNHTGLGAMASVFADGEWEIPTGAAAVDKALASSIVRHAPRLTMDAQAHMFEHSLEVQLPFILYFSKTARIVPITVLSAPLEDLKSIGRGIAAAVSECGYPVVVVASSDMSHFVPDEVARAKDRMAIERVLALDADGLYSVVRQEGISMCGYMPAVIALSAALELGAKEASLVKYSTSAETSGDYQSVVGYAGIIIK